MNKKLMEAIKNLFLSEDSTGCTGNVTVVSAKAVEKLRREYEKELKNKK